jgi:hypothetical protein
MERHKCEYCEKDAIGYQGFGCCFAYVCTEHAHPNLLALRKGEQLAGPEYCYERFLYEE